MNIYAGRKFGWGWPEHHEHGFLGGDDMKTSVGERILAPVAGNVTRTAHTVTITEPDGWKTQALELASTITQKTVSVGHGIGFAGQKWVHWHSIRPDGTRVPARFLQPPTPEKPPVENTRRKRSQMLLVKNPHPRPTAPVNEYWVVGNGQPYKFVGTSPANEQAEANAFAASVAAGPTLTPSVAQWDAGYLNQFTPPSGSGAGGLTTAEHNQLFDIADKGELGQALTSTAVLINEHTTTAVNGITLTAAP